LKLKCDEALSNIGFIFNLRRYNQEARNTIIASRRAAALRRTVMQSAMAAWQCSAAAQRADVAKVGPGRLCSPRQTLVS
jgi:hypothetical protein